MGKQYVMKNLEISVHVNMNMGYFQYASVWEDFVIRKPSFFYLIPSPYCFTME